MIQNNATVLKWGQKNEVPETHQYQDTSTPSFLKRKGIYFSSPDAPSPISIASIIPSANRSSNSVRKLFIISK